MRNHKSPVPMVEPSTLRVPSPLFPAGGNTCRLLHQYGGRASYLPEACHKGKAALNRDTRVRTPDEVPAQTYL